MVAFGGRVTCTVVIPDTQAGTNTLDGYRRQGFSLDYNGPRKRWSLYRKGKLVRVLGYSREEDSIIYKTLDMANRCRVYSPSSQGGRG